MLGPIVSLKVFGQRFILLNAIEEVNEIMEKRSAINSDRPYFEMVGGLYAIWFDRGSFTHVLSPECSGRRLWFSFLMGRASRRPEGSFIKRSADVLFTSGNHWLNNRP
jgi:hypothetical protein